MGILWAFFVMVVVVIGQATTVCPPKSMDGSPSLLIQSSFIILSNDYLCLVMNVIHPRLESLQADFHGNAQYGKNIFSTTAPHGGGFTLERIDMNGIRHMSSAVLGHVVIIVLHNTTQQISVAVNNVTDDELSPIIREEWILSLSRGSRFFNFTTSGVVLQNFQGRGLYHTIPLKPTSLFALFDRGTLQMMNAPPTKSVLASNLPLRRFYTLGGNASLQINNFPTSNTTGGVILKSANHGAELNSGISLMLGRSLCVNLDLWTTSNNLKCSVTVTQGTEWVSRYTFAPNNWDFPITTSLHNSQDSNLPWEDLQAFFTGVYASPVGQLISYYPATQGMSQTSLHTPNTGYGTLVNFWDPDNYFTVTALSWSGDPELQNEAKKIVETTGRFIKEDGQIPRKIDSVKGPIFDPFWTNGNGEWSPIMPGPNMFWTLAGFNYVKASGDFEWLQKMLPVFEKSLGFLRRMIAGPPHTCYNSVWSCPPPPKKCSQDVISRGLGVPPCGCFGGAPFIPNSGGSGVPYLISATGSLMNIPLRRGNFTSDTNAFFIHYLREFAEVEYSVGKKEFAEELLQVAHKIKEAFEVLWSEEGGHYITQLDHNGSRVDHFDYAANLMAVGFGIADEEKSKKILEGIEEDTCVGPGKHRATWVSKVRYTHKGKTMGDSTSSEGRVGYMDALARRAVGETQLSYFNNVILNPIRDDLRYRTWLSERYTCDGVPERTPYFFEYPCLTVMLLREVRYGINVGFVNASIAPFGVKKFTYNVGTTFVEYDNQIGVKVIVPGLGRRRFVVKGFDPSRRFEVKQSCPPVTPQYGVVGLDGSAVFRADVGLQCIITLNFV